MNRCRLLLACSSGFVMLMNAGLSALQAEQRAPKRPAVLVHCPYGQGAILGVDVEVLKEFRAAGLQVDYTDRHHEFTWERIKKYNVLVLYSCPGPEGVKLPNPPTPPDQAPFEREFIELVERFLAEGGGVFLMAYVRNTNYQFAKPMIDNWNAAIPVQWIKETDASKLGHLTRVSRVPLAFTDRVFDSPVSVGVRQLWYTASSRPHYHAGFSNPLVLGPEWTVVVRASKTARSNPVVLEESGFNPPANVSERFPAIDSPPIFAIREYKRGRIAFCSMLPVFTFASGKQWVFHSDVLTEGSGGKPSHFQTLIVNSLKWLGEPSVASGTLGGYTTDPARLMYVNERPEMKRRFEERFWSETELNYHRPAPGRLFKGLIGAKTALSGAEGSPTDYARAAKEAGLDFVVILDDFDKLTAATLEELKKACRDASDAAVLIIPGYTIDNNIGNHVFVYGPDVPWPRDDCLCGPQKTILKQQGIDAEGNYQRSSPVLMWVLHDVQKKTASQLGYFNFQDSPQGFRMEHGRTYGMGAIWTYENGKLVCDATDNYLVTAQGCVPPSPAAINIVRSPAHLKREAEARRGLMMGQAKSLETLQLDALSYLSALTYSAPNIFPTTGPVIHGWPECFRVHTFVIEDFVTGRNVMRSPIHVTSDVGLKEITIYDGTVLFRRFLLNGAKEFRETLVLNGTVQRNLVLIAEDVNGGKAVSYARRSRKCSDATEYCGDRVNTTGIFMFHGPGMVPVLQSPEVYGGYTWDGGPKGVAPLYRFIGSHPVVKTVQETEGEYLHNQHPMLGCSDEGVWLMDSIHDQVFPDYAWHKGMNPWGSYGPLVAPKLFTHVQQFVEWHHEAYRIRPAGPSSYGYGYGTLPTLFTTRIMFVKDLNIEDIQLLTFSGRDAHAEPCVVVATGDQTKVIPADRKRNLSLAMNPGDWFGLYSSKAANVNLFTVRDQPVRLDVKRGNTHLSLHADPANRLVRSGQTFTFSLATMTFPVDAEIDSVDQLIRCKHYFVNPTGLNVTGARVDSPGLLDYEAVDQRIEIQLPHPGWDTRMTLPFRARGFNPRWSAGLFMKKGYVTGHYGKGENRYRPLGVDPHGQIYFSVSADLAPAHHYVAGHPVTAEGEGSQELLIQVTQISGGTFLKGRETIQPFHWHVSVNNPTDEEIAATLTKNMDLPGLEFPDQKITLNPGHFHSIVD